MMPTSERNKRRIGKKASQHVDKPWLVSVTITNSQQHLIPYALASVCHQVDKCIVVDTGATDGTLPAAQATVGEKLVTKSFRWDDSFARARNAALDFARELGATWALMVDTDERFDWKDIDLRAALSALTQDAVLLASADGTYHKEKCFRLASKVHFVGDTHECPIAESQVTLPGPTFDEVGKSPEQYKGKFLRDARILANMVQLPEHKEDGRWWYYLGASYQSLGNLDQAERAFAQCVELRKPPSEEGAYAAYRRAECLCMLDRFEEAIEACTRGLSRYVGTAELAWLAGYACSKLGRADQAAIWGHLAIKLGRFEGLSPVRTGFVKLEASYEDPYNLLQFTAPTDKERQAAGVTWALAKRARLGARDEDDAERLAVDPSCKHRDALRTMLRPKHLAFSFGIERVDLPLDRERFGLAGYHPMNPSLCMHGQELAFVLRTVNYEIRRGQYVTSHPDGMVRTCNLLGWLDIRDGEALMRDLRPMRDLDPAPRQPTMVLGYEDVRLFSVGGKLWGSATVRDRDHDRCQIALLDFDDHGDVRGTSIQSEQTQYTEKNWMPIEGTEVRWIYSVCPTVIRRREGQMTAQPCTLALDHLRGGSQAIPFRNGYLAITHETIPQDGWGCRRIYLHRFVQFDANLQVTAVSPTFTFEPDHYGIEFCCGMARDPRDRENLVIAYGVEDAAAKLLIVDQEKIAALPWIKAPKGDA